LLSTFTPTKVDLDLLVDLGKMAKKGGAAGGETSKKAQGQARKAEAAASKQTAKNQQVEKAEAEEWKKGAKSNAKAYVMVTAAHREC
jgi:hypothetical protein